MQENLQLTIFSDAELKSATTPAALDPKILSSILVSTKIALEEAAESVKDPHAELVRLMESPAIGALLQSAAIFAAQSGVSGSEALRQIVVSLKQLDQLWGNVLLREGLARLSSQFH